MFLVLSTLGAWGLALLGPLGLDSPLLSAALTHVFLDLFSEGWFVLGGLGVTYAILDEDENVSPSWPLYLVGVGVPFSVLLALPASSLSITTELVGRGGGTLVGIGLLGMALRLGGTLPSEKKRRWLWGFPLGCLLLKALAQLAGGLVPGLWLGTHHGLRILYLHLMLLGFLSPALVAGAQRVWDGHGRRETWAFYAFPTAVGIVLVSLVPLTSLFPGPVAGASVVAAWAALLPLVAAGLLLARSVSLEVFPSGQRGFPEMSS